MIAQAKIKYTRVTPKKVRLVLDLIRGKDVRTSRAILMHTNKGCTEMVSKLLKSAVHNATEKGIEEEQLYISKIFADQGPVWKRWRAAPFGRAAGIVKKTSHITIELDLKKK